MVQTKIQASPGNMVKASVFPRTIWGLSQPSATKPSVDNPNRQLQPHPLHKLGKGGLLGTLWMLTSYIVDKVPSDTVGCLCFRQDSLTNTYQFKANEGGGAPYHLRLSITPAAVAAWEKLASPQLPPLSLSFIPLPLLFMPLTLLPPGLNKARYEATPHYHSED